MKCIGVLAEVHRANRILAQRQKTYGLKAEAGLSGTKRKNAQNSNCIIIRQSQPRKFLEK